MGREEIFLGQTDVHAVDRWDGGSDINLLYGFMEDKIELSELAKHRYMNADCWCLYWDCPVEQEEKQEFHQPAFSLWDGRSDVIGEAVDKYNGNYTEQDLSLIHI